MDLRAQHLRDADDDADDLGRGRSPAAEDDGGRPSGWGRVGRRAGGLRRILMESFGAYQRHDGMLLSSALAFHGLLSLAPLLVFAVAVAGAIFGREAATGELQEQLNRFSEPATARVLVRFVRSAGDVKVGSFAALVSLVVLMWTSTRFFIVLQGALNHVFGVRVKTQSGAIPAVAKRMARRRLVSFGMVGVASGLLLLSMLVTVALSAVGSVLEDLPAWALFVPLIELAVSVLGLGLAVAAIFRVLPDVELSFGNALRGGLLTALMVSLGGQIVGLWLGMASPASSYGAASSVVLFLLWAFWASQLFLFGAQLTAVWAKERGASLRPLPHAVRLEEREPVVGAGS